MNKFVNRLKSFPFYVFFIILFFITHGYSENVSLVPISDIIIFSVVAFLISILILWFFKKRMGSLLKSGIVTGLILIFYFFYGAFQDGLKHSGMFAGLSRYRVLLPLMILIVIISFFTIKKSQKNFLRLTFYANSLFIILIMVDGISIIVQFTGKNKSADIETGIVKNKFEKCDSCVKPDIYLIVLDEYWGNNSLKEYFGYDNAGFNSYLKKEGFFVASCPSSNYASTPLSMASTFDMDYIDWLKERKQVEAEDYGKAAKAITNSASIKFLKSLNYKIFNCSIFDLLDQPSKFNFGVLPINLRLITTKTLLGTIEKDLLWHARVGVASRLNWLAEHFQNKFEEGNNELLKLTDTAISAHDHPKFVYTHLMMPHFPCLFDSLGRKTGLNFFMDLPQQILDNSYLSYLVYSNAIATSIIKKIKERSKGKAVIILMSDHGYRSHKSSDDYVSSDNNFNSVFLPKKNYSLFYDSISNVNQFRVVFNTLFNQHFPMLKDSVVF